MSEKLLLEAKNLVKRFGLRRVLDGASLQLHAGEVVALHYTSHPSASERIGEIASSVLDELDPNGDCAVATVHRIGELTVGDVAFVVAVSSAHRRLAFEVCERVVEEVKAGLPVWKQQFVSGGDYSWSGL